MRILDATGNTFEGGAPPARIVSLVPSLTEALFALGAGDRIVGVTRYCEEPADQVARLPRVGGTKNPDLAAIATLRPDLVIASAEENRKDDVEGLHEAGLRVFVTHYETVRAAVEGIAAVALLLGVDGEPGWLIEARREVEQCSRRRDNRVPYFCPIWRRPYMVARGDTYMADLLHLAGGTSAIEAGGPAHYNAVDLEELRPANPAVIVLPDEPYPFAARHLRDFERFPEVDAVRQGRIHLVDGKALTWYGPRISGALRLFGGLFDAARARRWIAWLDRPARDCDRVRKAAFGPGMAGAAGAALALDLLARRAIARFETLDPEAIELPGRRFWLRGVAVHYREAGRGFPVVLVPGFGGSTFSFRFTEAVLAPHCRVLSVDLPGFGFSSRDPRFRYSTTAWARLLGEFLERLGVSRAAFVGCSTGGVVVQRLAAENPELVERLVLVSAPSTDRRPPRLPAFEPGLRLLQGLCAAFPALYGLAGRWLTAEPGFFDAAELQGYLQPLRVRGTAAAWRRMVRELRDDEPLDPGRIEAPTLVLWGERDRAVKLAEEWRLQRQIRGARLEVVLNAGHLVLEEQPRIANDLILEFLRDLAGEGSGPPSEARAQTLP